jgi:hypothetical protein
MLLLATFRAAGFAAFAGTRQGFLNSLAPLLAFPIVGALLALADGMGWRALGGLLGTLVALLAPAVASHALAQRWGREAGWLRYATAFNWCQWAVPVAALPTLVLAGVVMRLGVPLAVVTVGAMLAVLGYGLALHFFLARRGLELSRGRTVLLVLATNLATGVLAAGPRLLTGDFPGTL